MKEVVYYNNLFDIYNELLTEKEISTFKDYYQEDLSLSEIADSNQISRAAVQKTIKTVIDKLNNYEEKLHIYKTRTELSNAINCDDIDKIKDILKKLLDE